MAMGEDDMLPDGRTVGDLLAAERNSPRGELQRTIEELRAEIAVLRDRISRIQFPDTTGQ